MHAFADGRALD